MAYRWRQVATSPNIVRCDRSAALGRWLSDPRRIEPIKCSCGNLATLIQLSGAFSCRKGCAPITPINTDLSWWQKLTKGI